ncbi:autophagy-related 16 isoform X3 [Cotesia typhae]|uniref:autophagy-related 16 isoform X3 n=1 Tax=Cotesia typhae TaxID=2053667 RepID=UPI003D690C13
MASIDPLIRGEIKDWRKNIINQLRNRNKSQTRCFADLIYLHNRLFESTNTLRGENLQLTVAIEKLKCEVVGTGTGTGANAALEARLLAQAEELTMLHRRRGEHTQQIVDLNNKMQDMMKDLQSKESSLAESLELNASLRAELNTCVNRERELAEANQMLRDEYQALQLAFASLEEKLRKAQEENRQLVERLIKCKTKDAEKMNEENDNFLNEGFTSPTTFFMQTISKFGKRQAKVQKDLEDAARDTRAISPERINIKEGIPGLPTAVPTDVAVKFSAHDGEVSAVKWSPVDRILATGGADRKVKLWDISKGTFESKGMLIGSNASVMSVDFDSTGTLILGASNDFASRVWSVNDLRLRHTLTGHCAKVLAAKFLGEPSKVVTGSHDRTLKIWDLRSRACVSGLKDVKVEIPEAVAVGSQVTLTCRYDLQTDVLYAVKWYKGKDEFYRFVPKELPPLLVFGSLFAHNIDVNSSYHRSIPLGNDNRTRAYAELDFEITQDSFTSGKLKIICHANIFKLYKREAIATVEEERPRLASVLGTRDSPHTNVGSKHTAEWVLCVVTAANLVLRGLR